MNFSRLRGSSALRPLTSFFLVGIAFTAVAHAQVTFFTPPTYGAFGAAPTFVADFNGDGFPDILDSGGNLDLGNGNGTFRTGIPVSGTPLAVADFNGDGIPDILEQGTGTLVVLLGNGDGTFQAPLSTNSGAGMLTPIAAGDVNGDGKADVLGVYNGNLLVFINNGNGTFAAGLPYAVTDASIITLGDFNGDGNVDVAVSSSSGSGEEIVFLGNGNGTFQAGKTSAGVSLPAFAVTRDFNNDGNLDLVISGCGTCSETAVSILLGKGDGTFQAPTTITSYAGISIAGFVNVGTLAVGDVNGDGKPDLFLMNGLVEIFLSNGDGTFSAGNVYHPSNLGVAAGVAAADFNLDGKLDIVAAGTVMLGNGDGTLQAWPAVAVSADANPDGGVPIAVGNFNKNGAPEVAALTGSAVSILANDGTGVLSLAHAYALQQQGESIVVADINGDGNLDLVIGASNPNAGNWSYSVLLGNGDGSFQAAAFYQQNVASDGSTIVIADFNGDGKPDLAFPAGSGTVAVLLGNGDGTFGAPSYFYDGGAISVVSADFNGDGKADIAGGSNGSPIAVLLGNGNGTFQTAGFPISVGGAPLLAANLTGNGYADLIPGGLSVYLSNGNGTFTQTPTQAIPSLMTADGFADINGDGILDALGNVQNGGTHVGVALGNGNGTFGPYIVAVPSFLPMSPFSFVQAADLNGGGKQDLIVVDGIDGSIFTVINTTVSVPGTNFSPTSLSFPSQAVGSTSTAAPVTLSNTGAVALTVTKVTLGGANAAEFTQTNNCTTVQPMGSCTINLVFAPTTAGAASATLIVTDNAGTGSQTISLSGTATAAADFTFGAGSGGSSSSTISAGQTATFNLALTPAGSFSGTVNLACSITPAVTPAPVCSVPASVSITGSSATSVTVSVATTAAGSASGGPAIILPPWVGPVGWTLAVGTALLIFVGKRRRPVLSTAVMVLAFIAVGGCGGSSSSTSSGGKGTPAGTYAVTVTATSGSLSHQAALTVIVQ